MPTYEYHCNACKCDFEIEKRMSDPIEAECPACGSGQTHRLISHSSFVLKGSGWYVTDYARKDGKSGTGGDSGSRGKPAGDGRKEGASEPASTAPAASDATATPSTPATSTSPAAGASASASESASRTASTASPSS